METVVTAGLAAQIRVHIVITRAVIAVLAILEDSAALEVQVATLAVLAAHAAVAAASEAVLVAAVAEAAAVWEEGDSY